jgi:chromosome segregation ATPase
MEPEEQEELETLRTQLRDAINDCQRQIQILKHPVRSGSARAPDNSREIALLEDELKRLRDALAGL